jgi:hypothetical protein
MLITAFALFPDYSTDLILTRSYSAKGLPPPQPPVLDLPSQAEFDRKAAEQASRDWDAQAAKRVKERAAYEALIVAMFKKGHPALDACADVGTKRRSGRGRLYLCILEDGKASLARLDVALPRLPSFELCLHEALMAANFPPPPVGEQCLDIEHRY